MIRKHSHEKIGPQIAKWEDKIDEVITKDMVAGKRVSRIPFDSTCTKGFVQIIQSLYSLHGWQATIVIESEGPPYEPTGSHFVLEFDL